MNIRLFTDLDSLSAIAPQWDALAAGEPLRSYDWLTGWQRRYSDASRGELQVIGVFDGDDLRGLAPWRIERCFRRGVTMRWLGDGEVCTDHPTILTAPGAERDVAEALAAHLTDERGDWQLLEFTDVDQGETVVDHLCGALATRGALVDKVPGGSCWQLELPDDWEALLSLQSKSHRKQIRRSARQIEQSDTFAWHTVKTAADWRRAWPIFEDLHQRRRQSLGEPGCFASPRWADFHREVSQRLLERGQLRMFWSELDGQPLTAEYLFAGDDVWRAYQGGLDPDQLDEAPGRLSLICLLRAAIVEGVRKIDFMRGDEEYKPHWRATPHPTEHVRVVPPRLSAQLRHQADRFARGFRGAAKAGLRALGRGS